MRGNLLSNIKQLEDHLNCVSQGESFRDFHYSNLGELLKQNYSSLYSVEAAAGRFFGITFCLFLFHECICIIFEENTREVP